MTRKRLPDTPHSGRGTQDSSQPQPLTKTRLRRGEIGREKPEALRCAEIIDFVPPVHGDVEDILFDLAADDRDDTDPPRS